LSAVRDCLFNIFAATLHIGGRSSIRNLRTRHAVVAGTHLPTYHSFIVITTKKIVSLIIFQRVSRSSAVVCYLCVIYEHSKCKFYQELCLMGQRVEMIVGRFLKGPY